LKKILLLTILSCLVTNISIADSVDKTNPICIMKTSMGDVHIELYQDAAPRTVSNFIGLAQGTIPFKDPGTGNKIKRPFYNHLIFHRVIKNFMIQGGCPKGNGTSGPGYRFEDEINATALGLDKIKVIQPNGSPHPWLGIRSQLDYQRILILPLLKKMNIQDKKVSQKKKEMITQKISSLKLKECYENMGYQYRDDLKSVPPVRGAIAMANSGPNTNGSQFFINLVDTPWLAGKHTVFGRVIQGMDVVDQIGNASAKNSRPIKKIQIITINILNKAKADEP
jgi:cyclophilin family peptidyl-prolyl cis-trans isomerase